MNIRNASAPLRHPASPSTNCGSRAVRQIPNHRAAHQRSFRETPGGCAILLGSSGDDCQSGSDRQIELGASETETTVGKNDNGEIKHEGIGPQYRITIAGSPRSMLKTNRAPANPPSPIRNTECRCQERNGRCQTRSQRSETLAWSATAAVIDSDYDITCVGTMSSPQSTASQHPEMQACNGKINTEPFDRCTRTIELRSSL